MTSVVCLSLFGCASSTSGDNDPFETHNRHAYAMNKKLDEVLIQPITKGYTTVTPDPVQHSVHNFFENLDEIFITVNSLLQADFGRAGTSAGRFLINTTLGIGGLFDVASKMGLDYHYTDFGLTLAKYGYKDSAFLMLPFLGPSTVRDAMGIPVDQILLSPLTYVPSDYFYITYPALALEVIDTRAQFLDQDQLVKQAFDPYVFIRNAYLQNREHMVEQTEAGKPIVSDMQPDAVGHSNDVATDDDIYLED